MFRSQSDVSVAHFDQLGVFGGVRRQILIESVEKSSSSLSNRCIFRLIIGDDKIKHRNLLSSSTSLYCIETYLKHNLPQCIETGQLWLNSVQNTTSIVVRIGIDWSYQKKKKIVIYKNQNFLFTNNKNAYDHQTL
jgi:hypothetical protein